MNLVNENFLIKPLIIGCTAYVSHDIHDKCYAAGMDKVYTKPI